MKKDVIKMEWTYANDIYPGSDGYVWCLYYQDMETLPLGFTHDPELKIVSDERAPGFKNDGFFCIASSDRGKNGWRKVKTEKTLNRIQRKIDKINAAYEMYTSERKYYDELEKKPMVRGQKNWVPYFCYHSQTWSKDYITAPGELYFTDGTFISEKDVDEFCEKFNEKERRYKPER